ncbi:MAG: hypothetical protein JWO32_2819, partial [Bacteroidetes bacterium]|nr:hypothetical protein [Bacteroidota bacterium]
MKNLIIGSLFFVSSLLNAQEHFCAKAKKTSASQLISQQQRANLLVPQISHELKYDVKFVHLMLNVERTTKFISGGVKTVALVTAPSLDTFACLLHQNHAIDSVRFNGMLMTFTRKDSMVKVAPAVSLTAGQTFTVIVYYQGNPP